METRGSRRPLPSVPADPDTHATELATPGESRDPSGQQTTTLPVGAARTPVEDTSFQRAFGPYQIEDILGRGGMGVVYKAHDRNLGRLVALKMIRGFGGPEETERFFREAKALAQLKHRHIVKIHDFGQIDGQHYFTMEFAERGSLTKSVKNFTGQVRAAAVLLEKIARAVHYVHETNLLHRDLKTGNILLDAEEEPIVSDFGLAKQLDPTDFALTATGEVPGTPAYMAPEQLCGCAVNRATDIWALGVILFELVCGRRPFTGATRDKLTQAILHADPPEPRSLQPKIDRSLEAVILKCLKKDQRRRYATAGELADDLNRWLRGEPTLARPLSLPSRLVRRHRRALSVVLSLMLLTAIAAGAYHFVPNRQTLPDLQNEDGPDIVVKRDILPALERGERVVLLGETGHPLWSRWIFPGVQVDGPDGSYGFHSGAVSMLELLPSVPLDRYEFQVEVRQKLTPTGTVGIYGCRTGHELSWGELHGFCGLTFADSGAMSGKMNVNLYHRASPNQTHPKGINHAPLLALTKFPRTNPAAEAPWRKIAVKVTPQAMTWYWEGDLVATLKNEDRPEQARMAVASPYKSSMEGVRPEFPPDGGLGLYVYQTSASFRNAIIGPLAD